MSLPGARSFITQRGVAHKQTGDTSLYSGVAFTQLEAPCLKRIADVLDAAPAATYQLW